MQWRFNDKTGDLGVKELGESKFGVGDKVVLTKEYRIFGGVFEIDSIGRNVLSNTVSYACYRIDERGHTIWFSCGEIALEKAKN